MKKSRLPLLETLAAAGTADAFTLYALALEYRRLDRTEDAVQAFQNLRNKHASYLPMYLMAGQLLAELGRSGEAREWLETGVALAAAQGDGKARNELLAALADCD
jgi:hypothetical protein